MVPGAYHRVLSEVYSWVLQTLMAVAVMIKVVIPPVVEVL